MNTYKILLYNGSEFVDISSIVQTNVNIQDKLDLTLDFGSFVIPHAKASYSSIDGIDFSKAIKPWTPIVIDINYGAEIYYSYVTNSNRSIIGKGTTKRYKHDVTLIEPTKSLFSKIIPDMTITQPKTKLFIPTLFADSKAVSEVITHTPNWMDFDVINESLDTTKIESQTMKNANEEYKLVFNALIINEQFNYGGDFNPLTYVYGDGDVDLTIEIYTSANPTTPIKTYTTNIVAGGINMPASGVTLGNEIPSETQWIQTLDYTPTQINEEITVKAYTTGYFKTKPAVFSDWNYFEDEVTFAHFNLTISQGAEPEELNYKTILTETKKVIDSINLNYGTSYTLNSDTSDLIEGISAPELTFQSYTGWDALYKLANYVNAIPEIGLSGFNEISFTFLDQEPDLEYDISIFNEESMNYIFDDYNVGHELNANNVVEEDLLSNIKIEPYQDGWLSPRAKGTDVVQFKETNAAFKTRQRIYKIYSVKIKGLQVKIVKSGSSDIILNGNAGGSTWDDYAGNTYWDLSDLTIETQRWNTLENGTKNADDNQRINYNTKGNHIHYTQGDKYVFDLGYKTDVLSDIWGEKVAARALMETILKATAIYLNRLNDESILVGYETDPATSGDGEKAIIGDHILFKGVYGQIGYIPMTNLRSTLYKYNAYDLDTDSMKFSNEQDRMNDTINLGDYTRKTLNKLGNTIYTVSGRTKDYSSIPKLGYKTNDGKHIVSRNLSLNKNLITYDLELSENFLNQSSYIGINSAFRQYEVADTGYVHRQDKHKEFVIMCDDSDLGNVGATQSKFNQNGKTSLMYNFQKDYFSSYSTKPISYGKMTITKDETSSLPDNTEVFDLPINTVAIGNTINLQLEMEDNYSVGPRIRNAFIWDNTTNGWISNDDFSLQEYAKYTNYTGNFYSYTLALYNRGDVISSPNQVDADIYPIFNLNPDNSDPVMFNMTDVDVRKDAREKYGLNIELPILSSDNSKIRVYPGFAKYSAMIRGSEELDVKLALLTEDYFPGINDKYLKDTTLVYNKEQSEYISELVFVNNVSGLYISAVDVVPYKNYGGFVLYEEKTKELILAYKNDFMTTGTSYTFPKIWAVHKYGLTTTMYPDAPNTFTVLFEENGGDEVDNLFVYNGNYISLPITYREGYTFNGWYSDISLTTLFDEGATPITSDITLYAKWDVVAGINNEWDEIISTTYDTGMFIHVDSYECPIDSFYLSQLPDPNLYAVGHILRITVEKLCNPAQEVCYIDQDGVRLTTCTSKYYKVIV